MRRQLFFQQTLRSCVFACVLECVKVKGIGWVDLHLRQKLLCAVGVPETGPVDEHLRQNVIEQPLVPKVAAGIERQRQQPVRFVAAALYFCIGSHMPQNVGRVGMISAPVFLFGDQGRIMQDMAKLQQVLTDNIPIEAFHDRRLQGRARSGEVAGDGGPATSASIEALSLALDSAGNLFFGDGHNVVREVNAATGIVSTVAGNGTQGSSGDGGPATSASLYLPGGLLVDGRGNLFISSKFVVRRVDATTGIITTYAGNGTQGNSGDGGPAVAAEFKDPATLAFDPAGNLLILDTLAGTVRKVDATTGIITTLAGTGTLATQDLGDGGAAISAQFAYPTGLAVDSAGDLYIVDNTGTLVRKVDAATGIIHTVVGMVNVNGIPGYPNNVPATSVPLFRPTGAAMDGAGNLYVLNTATIRQIPASLAALTFPTATNIGTADAIDDPLSVTLYDIGNTSLTFTTPATGTDPVISAAWSLDNSATCAQITPASATFSLASGAGCTLAIDFTPTVTGNNSGTLTVTDSSLNVSASTQIVTLAGTGVGTASATATLTPATVNFGSVQVGGSASTPLTLTNTGTTAITITAVAIPSPVFTLSSQTCGTTLAAGGSCTYTITYTPTATGAASSTFSVTDTAGTQSSALFGTGLAAGSLTITPIVQQFPASAVGTTATVQASTISNTTAQPIYLSSGSLTDSSDFAQSDNCNGLIAAGGTCTVVFSFTPKTTGALNSTYNIHNLNTPASVLSVTLSGTGTGAPVATLSPAALTFATVVNTPAVNQTVTLTTSGNAPLTISSVTLGGASPGSFTVASQTCAATLAANSSCTVTERRIYRPPIGKKWVRW